MYFSWYQENHPPCWHDDEPLKDSSRQELKDRCCRKAQWVSFFLTLILQVELERTGPPFICITVQHGALCEGDIPFCIYKNDCIGPKWADWQKMWSFISRNQDSCCIFNWMKQKGKLVWQAPEVETNMIKLEWTIVRRHWPCAVIRGADKHRWQSFDQWLTVKTSMAFQNWIRYIPVKKGEKKCWERIFLTF